MNSKNEKEIKKHNSFNILILNKIQHKSLLIELILNYIKIRPYILPYLLDHDNILKSSLKKAFSQFEKEKSSSKEINSSIYTFIIYRLLYEAKYDEIPRIIENKLMNDNNNLELDKLINNHNYIGHLLIEHFLKTK